MEILTDCFSSLMVVKLGKEPLFFNVVLFFFSTLCKFWGVFFVCIFWTLDL